MMLRSDFSLKTKVTQQQKEKDNATSARNYYSNSSSSSALQQYIKRRSDHLLYQYLLFLTLQGRETNYFRGHRLYPKIRYRKNIYEDPESKVPTLAKKYVNKFLKITSSEKQKAG